MGRAVHYSCDTCGVVVNIPQGTGQGFKGKSANEHLRKMGWAVSGSDTFCQNCRKRNVPRGGKTPSTVLTLAREALANLDGVLDDTQLAALHQVIDRRSYSPRYNRANGATAVEPPAPATEKDLPPRTKPGLHPRGFADVDRHEIAAALNKLSKLQLSQFCEVIRKMRGAPDDVGLANNGRDADHGTLLAHAKREAKITDRSKPGTAASLLAKVYGVTFF